MPNEASRVSGKYYFADAVVGSNEYHGIDLTKPLNSHNLELTGSAILTDSEGNNSTTWQSIGYGVICEDIKVDTETNIVSFKLAPSAAGTYLFKVKIPVSYTDGSLRVEDLVYNVYLTVIK